MKEKLLSSPSDTTSSSIPAVIGEVKVKDIAVAALSRGRELYALSSSGVTSLRALVILTALVVIITSFMGFVTNILTIHITGAILDIYCIIFGLIACLLESDKDKNPFGIRRNISTYFYFLDFAYGKSAFYVFLGTLKIFQVCLCVFASIVRCGFIVRHNLTIEKSSFPRSLTL